MSKKPKFYDSVLYRWKVYPADELIRNDVNTYIIHVYEGGTGDIWQVSYQPERSRVAVSLMRYDDTTIIEFNVTDWNEAEFLVRLLSTYGNREVMPLFQLSKPERIK